MDLSYDLAGQRLNAELFHELIICMFGPLRVKRNHPLQSRDGRTVTVPFLVDDYVAVEWLGPESFTTTKRIWEDEFTAAVISEHDMPKINVPYFIQLNPETFQSLFGQEANIQNASQSGFCKNDVLPCDFNSYGEDRFMEMYRQLPEGAQCEVLDSLSTLQKETEWSVFGQTLIYRELLGPASLRNFYAARAS